MIRTLQHCKFAGKNYRTGDVVPASAVPKKMLGVLCDMGVIEVLADPPPVEEPKAEEPKPKPKKSAKR